MYAIFGLVLVIFSFSASIAYFLNAEQATATYINQKYLKYGYMEVKKYSSRGWAVNLAGETRHQWANNVSLRFSFSECLNNEYKPSFLDLKFRLCDFINKEPYVGAMLKSAGVVCPAPPADYKFMNMSMKAESIAHVWPFEKGRVDCAVFITATSEVIAKGHIIATFRLEKEKKKRKPK